MPVMLTELTLDLSNTIELIVLVAAIVAAIAGTYSLSRRQIQRDVDRVEAEALNAATNAAKAWKEQSEAAALKIEAQTEELRTVKAELTSVKTQLNDAQGIIFQLQRERHDCSEQVNRLQERVNTLEALIRGRLQGN